jgi:hypothetical protein
MAAILDRHMEWRQFIVGDGMMISDCVTAEQRLINDCPPLRAYLARISAPPKGPTADCRSFRQRQGIAPAVGGRFISRPSRRGGVYQPPPAVSSGH